MLVKRLSDQRFDYCLPADVQFLAALSSSSSIGEEKSTLTRWIELIMWPELVKSARRPSPCLRDSQGCLPTRASSVYEFSS